MNILLKCNAEDIDHIFYYVFAYLVHLFSNTSQELTN